MAKNIKAKLDLSIDKRGIDAVRKDLEAIKEVARKTRGEVRGMFGGGRGGAGGGGGGAGPGAGGGGGAGGVRSRFGGRGTGGQIPYPSESGAGRMLGSIPVVGALAAGALMSMRHNYGHFARFQAAQMGAAPFGTPAGAWTGTKYGYGPTQTMGIQASLARASGRRTGSSEVTQALPFMRGLGLSAESIGGYFRPGAAGLGGVFGGGSMTDTLTSAIATGFKIGFENVRLGELLQEISTTVEAAGRAGYDVTMAGMQSLIGDLGSRAGGAFSGSRAVSAAKTMIGMRQGVLSGKGDSFMSAAMLRRAGWGSGKSYREAMLNLEEMTKSPDVFAQMLRDATAGMGESTRFASIQQYTGWSPKQVETFLSGKPGPTEAGPVDAEGRAKGVMARYGGTAAHRARVEAGRVGIGRKSAGTIRSLERTLLKVEGAITSVAGPLIEKLARGLEEMVGGMGELVDALQGDGVEAATKAFHKLLTGKEWREATGESTTYRGVVIPTEEERAATRQDLMIKYTTRGGLSAEKAIEKARAVEAAQYQGGMRALQTARKRGATVTKERSTDLLHHVGMRGGGGAAGVYSIEEGPGDQSSIRILIDPHSSMPSVRGSDVHIPVSMIRGYG